MPSLSPQSGPASEPSGYQGIRAAVLTELKKTDGLTTRELSARLRTSINNVRHHLRELEEQSLVEYERQHRGVGAPTFAYRLTPAGRALFPRRYESVLGHLLQHLVQQSGHAGVAALLEGRYSSLTHRLQSELDGATPAHRMESLAALLSAEGYMAEASLDGSVGTLIEHNCAIQSVAEQFPEICAAEARFLSEVLGGDVERKQHILNGCSACEYRVRFAAASPTEAGSTPAEKPVLPATEQENP